MNNNKTTWITFEDLALEYQISENNCINTHECNTYLEQVERDDILPFSKGSFRFSSDIWDFSSYTSLNIDKSELRFFFDSICQDFKKIEKQFVLISLINNHTKIQTIVNKHKYIRKFLRFLESNSILSISSLSVAILSDFFNDCNKENLTLATIRNYKNSIKDFLLFYDTNIESLDNELINFVEIKNKQALKASKENRKAKPIPEWYYNKLLSGLVHYMNDNNCPFYIKGPACIYILLSQVGLRSAENLGLTTQSKRTKFLFNGDKISYLHYKSWKGVKGNNQNSDNFTYMNELTQKAYDCLLNIPEYKERRREWNIDYLYCGSLNTKKEDFPLSSKSFISDALELWKSLDVDGFIKTINLDPEMYPFLNICKSRNISKSKLNFSIVGEPIKTLARPTTQQFRFHVITELYEKGVPLPYIKRFMSHLTEDMTKYHIHKGNNVQEDLEAAKRVLSGIVTGDEKIIGGDKGLTENIQKFIEANHFNVEKDLDAIVSKLAEDIPIRVKTGGVCIKSSRFRPCSIDSRTDEMYCAYNVCPNLFHFFYHCGITWRKCKELKEAIDINQKRGLLKQVYKDSNNLRSIISHQLLPEMDELQVQLNDKGKNTISEKYPDLIDIIENFDEIKKEVTSWLQQTQQK